MISKLRISRDLLVISALTLSTIVTWIGLDIYRNLMAKEIPTVSAKQLAPFDSEIRVETIDILESRLKEIASPAPTVPIVQTTSPSGESSPSAELKQ